MDPWGKLARLPRREIEQLQNQKLHHFINNYLYPFSPHYRQVFDQQKINPRRIRKATDLAAIPLISKLDFFTKDNPEKTKEFVLQPDKEKIRRFWPFPKLVEMQMISAFKGSAYVQDVLGQEFRPVFITFTTGTTNKPVSFIYSKYDIDNLYVSGSRMLNLFAMGPADYVVNMFPFAPHLAFWQVVFGGLSSAVLILSTGGGKMMTTEGQVMALLKMRPSVILGVPSYVYHVLRYAHEKGHRLESIKKVVLGAARVTSAYKLRLQELLESMGAKDVSVFGTYGFTEARCAWAECPTTNDLSSGYHLYPDKEIFEVVDPKTGAVKGEGEDGELVYSSIDSRGSSLIRYRTGDFVKGGITWEPCPYCRRTVPRISSDITRISDVKDLHLTKIKGSLVNFNNFDTTLSDFPEIEEWQIELCKKDNDPFEVDELIVYISCHNGVNQAALAEDVKKKLKLCTEVAPNQVIFVPLPDMIKRLELETSSKEKRFLDRRPQH